MHRHRRERQRRLSTRMGVIDRAGQVSTAIWDGQSLFEALTAAADWLTVHRDRVNALNVFPVPDGDTGINMALTLRGAIDEAQSLTPVERRVATSVASTAAHGALMGARGNSGVILSQVLRGFAHGISGREEIDGRDLAHALASSRDLAYTAVMRPVEGTMLTVVRAAAERAAEVACRTPSLSTVLAAALQGAREALTSTPDLLDVLRQAGVVDAGGEGLVLILEGMDYIARGEPIPAAAPAIDRSLGAEMAFLDQLHDFQGEEAFGYCTNFMVFGEGIDFPRVREELSELGSSSVIVGDESIIKVHIHTLNPGRVLDYAIQFGELGQIKIDNMTRQTEALTDQRREALVAPEVPAEEHLVGRQAVLTVASGEGLSEALRSMGATAIVAGGQTMNPSVEELLSAVETAESDEVIVLPNNSNIVMAANHVPELTTKRVRVVPSRSAPQSIAALAAFNADADLATNVAHMTEAMSSVRTVEITRAEKDAAVDDVTVTRGQVIGLLDDQLVAGGIDLAEVTLEALNRAKLGEAELITLFAGEAAQTSDTERVRSRIERDHPAVTVEIYDGGQPHYHYVIAVE